MTKFTDGKQIATITMTDNNTGCDYENEFFEVGGLKLNEELNAYEVEDVTYLTDYAQSYVDGTNPDVMTMATKAIGNADGCGVPTIKPWNIDTVKEKMAQAKASGCFAVAMDVDAAGSAFLKQYRPRPPAARALPSWPRSSSWPSAPSSSRAS